MTEDEEVLRRRLHRAAERIEVRPSFAEVDRQSRRHKRRRHLMVVATALASAFVVSQFLTRDDRSSEVSARLDEPTTTAGDHRAAPIRIDVSPVESACCRSNRIIGTLRADRAAGCLFLIGQSAERYHLVFPHGSTVATDPLRVLDATGKVLATVDQPVDFGGSIADPVPVEPSDATCGASKSIYVWKG